MTCPFCDRGPTKKSFRYSNAVWACGTIEWDDAKHDRSRKCYEAEIEPLRERVKTLEMRGIV
jgi:hypothetical protein